MYHAPRVIYVDRKYMDHTVIDVQRHFLKEFTFILAMLVTKIIFHTIIGTLKLIFAFYYICLMIINDYPELAM